MTVMLVDSSETAFKIAGAGVRCREESWARAAGAGDARGGQPSTDFVAGNVMAICCAAVADSGAAR
jgi:hypothetical protein